jgi:hypothetical protein
LDREIKGGGRKIRFSKYLAEPEADINKSCKIIKGILI